jgi:hypothetical protein
MKILEGKVDAHGCCETMKSQDSVEGIRAFEICPLVGQVQVVHHFTREGGEASADEAHAIIRFSVRPFVCRLKVETLLVGERLLYVTGCCPHFALRSRSAEVVHVQPVIGKIVIEAWTCGLRIMLNVSLLMPPPGSRSQFVDLGLENYLSHPPLPSALRPNLQSLSTASHTLVPNAMNTSTSFNRHDRKLRFAFGSLSSHQNVLDCDIREGDIGIPYGIRYDDHDNSLKFYDFSEEWSDGEGKSLFAIVSLNLPVRVSLPKNEGGGGVEPPECVDGWMVALRYDPIFLQSEFPHQTGDRQRRRAGVYCSRPREICMETERISFRGEYHCLWAAVVA